MHTHPQMNMPSRGMPSQDVPTGCRVGSMVHGTMLSTYCMYGTPYVRTTCTSTCRCTVSMHPQDVVCICTTGWHAILGVHHRRTPSGCPSVAGYHRWCICCAESIPCCDGTMQGQNTSSSWSKRIFSPVMEWYISMHNS